MYKITFLLAIVCSALADEAPRGEVFVHENVDFRAGNFGGKLCTGAGKCASKTEITSVHVPIPHNCQAMCRHNYESTCAAAYYDPADGHCHILSERCTNAELTQKGGNYVYFSRVMHTETDCQDQSPLVEYVAPEPIYADTYCLTKGKSCSGAEMYQNPWRNKGKQFCLDRCSKILTCEMVDWEANQGEDLDDPAAKGTCHHKVTKCSSLDDVANSYSYRRQLKGEDPCPLSIDYCHKGNLRSCSWINGDFYIEGGYVDSEQACLDWCSDTSGCRVVAYGIPGEKFPNYCELHRQPWCRQDAVNPGDRFKAYVRRDFAGQPCDQVEHFAA